MTPRDIVIFRVWKDGDDIIALFPYIPGNCNPCTCSSYMHVGQHGAADPHLVVRKTRPARSEEYMSLMKELELVGYSMVVRKRMPTNAIDVRRMAHEELERANRGGSDE